MRFLLLFFFTSLSSILFAQAPALIPYQAVARDASGAALNGATINARFTIHDGTATGAAVWQELQTVTTSALGLFTAQLGSSVSLSGVNWANGSKFMQVEIDLGQGFVDMGTQQMLSVPYALYSTNAGSAFNAENAGNGISGVSQTGDTLYLANGSYFIVPGISLANGNGDGTTTGTTLHTCGAPNVHNPDLTYGSMTDQEGNVYKTIVIGTQEWMAENLNTSIYRNGDAIPTGLSNAEWENTINTQQGAWAYYNNNASYACPYGKLYNWFACTDPRGLCPVGWHVPSDAEWTVLTDFLGGESVAFGKMKTMGTIESSTGLWYAPNQGASNSSGFSGIPGGGGVNLGGYSVIGYDGFLWSSTEPETFYDEHYYAWVRYLGFIDNSYAFRFYDNMEKGFSVRCLRD
jgi:uncharacterized protein (TIGR02145 family)